MDVEQTTQTRFKGLPIEGQQAFLTDDQPVGKIVKLLPGDDGRVAFLIIRTAHLWGHHKIIPVELVRDVNPKGVWLSIEQSAFHELPDYKTDALIADEVETALWKDEILRFTDYREVAVRVKDGVVSLTGHIIGIMNQERIETAVGNVKGILGTKIHLIADDKLLLKVAQALIRIERIEGSHVFAKLQNGVVILSGKVMSADVRNLAEKYAGNVPWVRGVINTIVAPGIDVDAEDQRFLQPAIGEEILFSDGLFAFVKQVIINRNNRRVVDIVIQGHFPDRELQSASHMSDEAQSPERLVVIPVSVIRYLTSNTGFLLINSKEITRYQDFDPANFVAPNANWVPPYPYSADNVRFFAQVPSKNDHEVKV
jgi:osmotically-inducible protein OsmY